MRSCKLATTLGVLVILSQVETSMNGVLKACSVFVYIEVLIGKLCGKQFIF